MELRVFPLPPLETNAYVALGGGEAVLFDAPPGAVAVVAEVLRTSGARLAGLVLTHGHWDHMHDAAEVRERWGVPVWAHPGDRLLLEQPWLQGAFALPGMRLRPARVDHWLAHGQSHRWAGVDWQVRHVPGHSEGSVLLHAAAAGLAIAGDLIFCGGVGRTDLPGGSWAALERSIRTQVYTLPEETVLHPGHGPETSVLDEMEGNPDVPA